jgi:hypothetical protein
MKKKQSWKDNVQKVYSSLEELRGYDFMYNLAERAGYDKNDVETMWEENKVIGGSVFPRDFGLAEK